MEAIHKLAQEMCPDQKLAEITGALGNGPMAALGEEAQKTDLKPRRREVDVLERQQEVVLLIEDVNLDEGKQDTSNRKRNSEEEKDVSPKLVKMF